MRFFQLTPRDDYFATEAVFTPDGEAQRFFCKTTEGFAIDLATGDAILFHPLTPITTERGSK